MTVIRTQVTLKAVSGLAEDDVVNTLHFQGAVGIGDSDLDGIEAAILDFYNVAPAGYSDTVARNLAATLRRGSGSLEIRHYDMGDPKPRVPLRESLLSLNGSPNVAADEPREVALCMSYHAAPASGVAMARRRGRIYVGPLNQGANDGTGRPSGAFFNVLRLSAARLLTTAQAAGNWDWVVYSPTTDAGGATPDASAATVVGGWVDNAFDTQRRRGLAPTTRSTFP